MIVVISPRGFNNYGQDEIEFMKKHNINVHLMNLEHYVRMQME